MREFPYDLRKSSRYNASIFLKRCRPGFIPRTQWDTMVAVARTDPRRILTLAQVTSIAKAVHFEYRITKEAEDALIAEFD